MPRLLHLCVLAVFLGIAWIPLPAASADPCPQLRARQDAPDAATRIVAIACDEHQAWYRPFIDREGRLTGSFVREADSTPLATGQAAWLRVADYWRESGVLGRVGQRPGAIDCHRASDLQPSPACRAFLLDTPWSAAFVSWVMRRAGLPGFTASASHVDYARAAYRDPQGSAYRIADPRAARPAPGDLLCYTRTGEEYGFGGLATLFSQHDGGLGMHCDIVVSVGETGDRTARLVGGNVFDGVTMRLLPLTAGGQFETLPTPARYICTPDTPDACSANRQDWAALLQLRPQAELAGLAPPPVPSPAATVPRCCIHCVVGAGVPRCPPDRRQ